MAFSLTLPPSPLLRTKPSFSLKLPFHPLALTHIRTPNPRCHRPLFFLAAAAPELGAVESDEKTSSSPTTHAEEQRLKESVGVLKAAAKTRKVAPGDVLSALSVIKNAKIEPAVFLETLGGTASPGRTWMLIFTAQGKLEKGLYFPLTAVQRFDAAAKRIENGIYLGPIGCLTFEGKFSWKKRVLAFVFEFIRIKIGPLGPLEVSLKKEEREPSTKDPFFIWFYVDEEIAVAQGRSGGIAFWCRCHRVT